jgi:hypothetical protein
MQYYAEEGKLCFRIVAVSCGKSAWLHENVKYAIFIACFSFEGDSNLFLEKSA